MAVSSVGWRSIDDDVSVDAATRALFAFNKKKKKTFPVRRLETRGRAAAPGARDAIRSVSRPRASTFPVSCPRRSSRQSINARFTYACVRVRVPSVGVRRPSSRGQARAHHAGAVEKLDGAYLLLSFSPGNSGYSFASGGAVGSDMVGFAVSFTGWGGAFTGSGAGSGTVEGSGGVGSCCLESFPPIGEWRGRRWRTSAKS